MVKKTQPKSTYNKKIINNFKFKNYYIWLITFLIFFVINISTKDSNLRLISISILPLILGIIYENKKLSQNWLTILKSIGYSIAISFIVLISSKESTYDFESNFLVFSFFFVIIFTISSIIVNEKHVIPKLTEGITLIQSISLIYWMIDYKLYESQEWYMILVLCIFLALIIFSIIHAFTYFKITIKTRLLLSIWSSIIMIIFATEHIYRVLNINYIENRFSFNDAFITMQYFFLGTALMYILQNFFMLVVYLPGNGKFYGKEHKSEISQTNKEHIYRYSENQVNIFDSFFCTIYCSIIYILNIKFAFIPKHTAIWLTIFTLPIILNLKNKLLT